MYVHICAAKYLTVNQKNTRLETGLDCTIVNLGTWFSLGMNKTTANAGGTSGAHTTVGEALSVLLQALGSASEVHLVQCSLK